MSHECLTTVDILKVLKALFPITLKLNLPPICPSFVNIIWPLWFTGSAAIWEPLIPFSLPISKFIVPIWLLNAWVISVFWLVELSANVCTACVASCWGVFTYKIKTRYTSNQNVEYLTPQKICPENDKICRQTSDS